MYILDIIVGTRPNFAKAAPIIRAIESKKKSQLNLLIILGSITTTIFLSLSCNN